MHHRTHAALAGTLLLVIAAGAEAQQGAPYAHVALGFNVARRCPSVRVAGEDDTPVAGVTFLVGASGVPSRPSVTAPSGSEELDAAAVSCVLRLRFQPATRVGDGMAMESWQQMGWKWAPAARPSVASTAPPSAAAAPLPHGSGGPAPGVAAAVSDSSAPAGLAPGADRGAELQVCVDESGKLVAAPKLTRSSGNAQFDSAAIEVARAGSGSYRASMDGRATGGCVRVTIAPVRP